MCVAPPAACLQNPREPELLDPKVTTQLPELVEKKKRQEFPMAPVRLEYMPVTACLVFCIAFLYTLRQQLSDAPVRAGVTNRSL